MVELILASKSKVRKKILDENNINSRVEPSNVDEDVIKVKSYKSVYTRRIVGTGEQKKIQISRTVTEFDDFKIGDQVQHNLFGIGTILVLSGTGENQKVGVEFDGGLRKKLIVKYARLKKID